MMYSLHEDEREHRYGDHGPKYLEKGPCLNFGIVKLQPGNIVSPHLHHMMQESFFVLEGCVTIYILKEDGTWMKTEHEKGKYIHLEPGEGHKICNESSEVLRMIVVAAPFSEGDKENI